MIEVWTFGLSVILYSAIGVAIGIFLLYLLIIKIGKVTKMKLENKQQKVLLAIAVMVKLMLSPFFVQQYQEYTGRVYLYGFPYYFFTWRIREVEAVDTSVFPVLPFDYTLNLLQMLFNILVIYFLVLLLYKLYSKIFLPKSSQQS